MQVGTRAAFRESRCGRVIKEVQSEGCSYGVRCLTTLSAQNAVPCLISAEPCAFTVQLALAMRGLKQASLDLLKVALAEITEPDPAVHESKVRSRREVKGFQSMSV